MATTPEKALEIAAKRGEFHEDGFCERTIGARGGVKEKVKVWRVTSYIKRWKREPLRFQFSVAMGLYEHGTIHNGNIDLIHAPDECPLRLTDDPVVAPKRGR